MHLISGTAAYHSL